MDWSGSTLYNANLIDLTEFFNFFPHMLIQKKNLLYKMDCNLPIICSLSLFQYQFLEFIFCHSVFVRGFLW